MGALDQFIEQGAFDSRSHAVRSGLETVINARRREELDRRYRDAAAQLPESREEIGVPPVLWTPDG